MVGDLDNRVGDIKSTGRITPLIGNNRESITCLRKLQHRLDEILAKGAIDPRRSHNDVLRIGLCNQTLAFKLGASINTARSGSIRFNVRFVSVARKNIISRQMDDRSTAGLRSFSNCFSASGIRRKRKCLFILGQIHRSVCSGRHDEIGLDRRDGTVHGARLCQIQFRTTQRNHIQIGTLNRLLKKALNNLPFPPGDKDFHALAPFTDVLPRRSPAYVPLRIGSHHHALSRYH